MKSVVSISSKLQTELVKISSIIAKGMYLVKVTDTKDQTVFTERILVQ
jgi:hypothetical protein